MNVLSLFDGVSCGQLALQRAGVVVHKYYASEIDQRAVDVTQRHWPDTIQLGDIKTINTTNLPPIDLIMGGSPCQGFSVASGRPKNFKDERSALVFDFIDIVNKLKPKYWLLENVRMAKECKEYIDYELGVKANQVNSADFSAQDRIRLYWTNIPFSMDWDKDASTVEDILEPEVDTKYVVEPRRAVTILDNEVNRRKIAYIGTDSIQNRIYKIHGKSVTINAKAGGLGAKTGLYALPALRVDKVTPTYNGGRFKPSAAKFNTITACDRHGILTNHFIRRLTPVECERLQTLPDNYTSGHSDTQRYKMIGNGWTVDLLAHIFKGMLNGKPPIKPYRYSLFD